MSGRLADHFLAARGTFADLGGFATNMGPRIARAQRFEISDEVARAAGELISSRPSTLFAALPLCRLPYETMWIEYRGGLGPEQRRRREFDNAPVPWKQGVLVEAMPGGQTGFMTIAWMHDHNDVRGLHPINISPIATYFDWRADGDVRDLVRIAHDEIIEAIEQPEVRGINELYCKHLERKWMDWANIDAVRVALTGATAWEKYRDDPHEIEGIQKLYLHMMPGLSPHGAGLVATSMAMLGKNDEQMTKLMQMFEADMQGEGGWVQCFLAMLNSRNPVVEHEPVDVSRLNKARRKSGKSEFLSYSKTRLAMSRAQVRMAKAQGVSREAAQQHLVRGHFKIRINKRTGASGVFWWSPFLRGDPTKGRAARPNYEVVK